MPLRVLLPVIPAVACRSATRDVTAHVRADAIVLSAEGAIENATVFAYLADLSPLVPLPVINVHQWSS